MTTKKQNENNTQFKQSNVEPIFTNVKDAENKIHICVGQNVVSTKTFDTFKQADDYIRTKSWELIANVSAVITQQIIKEHDKGNSSTDQTTTE